MDAVLNWLWQGGVVAAALRLMLFPLERASANVRYVVCWAAALFVIALPALPSPPIDAGVTRCVSRNPERGDCLVA